MTVRLHTFFGWTFIPMYVITSSSWMLSNWNPVHTLRFLLMTFTPLLTWPQLWILYKNYKTTVNKLKLAGACCQKSSQSLPFLRFYHRKFRNGYYRYSLSTIKDWDLLHQRHFGVIFARLLRSAGITNENEIQYSGSPTPRVSNDVTFGHAHTLCSAIIMASLVNPLDGDKNNNAKKRQLKTQWISVIFWWHRELRAF